MSDEEMIGYFSSGMVTSNDRITGPGLEGELPAAEVAALLGARAPVMVAPAAEPPVIVHRYAVPAEQPPATGSVIRVVLLLALLGGLAWYWTNSRPVARASVAAGSEPVTVSNSDSTAARPAQPDVDSILAGGPMASSGQESPPPPVEQYKGQRDWFGLARALEDGRDWNGLLAHCIKWSAEEPDNYRPWMFKGAALDYLERDSEAVDAINRGLQLEKHDAGLWDNLAIVLNQLNRSAEAEGAARKAIEVDGNFARPWNQLGVSFNRRGMVPEAVAAYDHCTRLDPGNDLCWLNLADGYYGLKRYVEAANAYKQIPLASKSGERARVGLENIAAMQNIQNTH